MSTLVPDAVSPRFELAGEIGSGAIAVVARVIDRSDGAAYAGKILHDRHRRDEAATRRFHREAELASRLVHENLVRVFGTQEIGGRPALLMELVEGPNLADHLARRGVRPEAELLPLALGIARGLSYAHAAGVIHRDLKPANILLATGAGGALVPKIADFGMARASSFASADKGALTVLGTPQYMAPECLEPLAVDPRTDLYALGCIIVEMATGAPPFCGATPFAVLEQHRNAPIPELPEGYSPGLRRLVTRLLAKAPGDRPQSASAVVDAISMMLPGSTMVPFQAGSAALAPVDLDAAADGCCAGCGAAVLQETRVCFRCGLVQVVVERGDWSVFVTGPGEVSHKLDSGRRDRLLRWLRANAAVGLDPTELERRIPRLPFTLVCGVSERSAETMRASLQRIGIAAVRERGGRRSHAGIYRNTNKLAGRTMTILCAFALAPMMVVAPVAVVTLPALAVALPVVYGRTLMQVSRPVVTIGRPSDRRLPPRVQARLERLHEVVGHIGERRHREALRAVVHRVIALSRDTPGQMQPEIEAEMEHALHLAAGATMRMDQLDRDMSHPGFDPAEPWARAIMHERDLWSARLLDLTATLDALAARRAAAQATMADARMPDELQALRATVEALEEVQRG
ncbi:serine/threonine-protein kinase [Paraliomyxa miuraensis]|uniref:serine/threonine-protein kinase n=1 Tax=Paraliomyxa miuraensis TaxID=376150 RepID=UPI0022530D86|nr:serine/threonine-protein kinase [Paraliomyxa miuraensis]MCX4247821.1 serine/threonine protein kinase [Paraliomyxa miuraensis]